MSERIPSDDFFLFVTVMYVVDILVRMLGLGWRSYSANGWNIFDIIVAGGSLVATLIVRFNTGGFVIQQLQKLFITSIAFKLVQRVNSLNKLFKTAVYVITPVYACIVVLKPVTGGVFRSFSVCSGFGLSCSCSSRSSSWRSSV